MTVTTSGMIDLTEDDEMDTAPPPVDHSSLDTSIDMPVETPEKPKDKTTGSADTEKATPADKVVVEKDKNSEKKVIEEKVKKSEKKAIEKYAKEDTEEKAKIETEATAIKDSTGESSASTKESEDSSSSTPVKEHTDSKIEVDSKGDVDKKDTTKTEPIAGTSKEEPISTTKKEEPTAGTSKEEPFAGTSKEEPIAGTSKEEPIAGTSKEEPIAGTSKTEPIEGTSKINEKGDASVTAKKDGASYTEMDEDVKPIKEELDKQIHALKTVLAHRGSQTVPTVVKFASPDEVVLESLSQLEQKQMLLQKARELEENKRCLKSLQDNIWQLLKIIVPDFDYGNPDNIENIILDFIRVNGEAS